MFKYFSTAGAYAAFRGGLTLQGGSAGLWPLPHPERSDHDNCVYTNEMPCGSMRAAGPPR